MKRNGSLRDVGFYVLIAILLIVLVFSIVSGIFALLIQFAGPILLILFLYWFIKSLRR